MAHASTPRARRQAPGAWAWRCCWPSAPKRVGFFAPDTCGLAGRRAWRWRRRRSALAGLRGLHQGPDRAAPRPAEHQCADDGGRHRRLRHRPVARGGDGDGAVCHRRADRGARRRPRAQCHPGPDGARARAGRRCGRPTAAGAVPVGDGARSAPSCACARASACRSTAWSPRAAAASTRRRSPARASRSTRRSGDPVFAGTINQTGELELRVTAPASNSTLARIIHAVEEAQGTRAPTQRFVDRFAAVYTPAVFVLALAVALLAPLAAGLDLARRRSTRRWCCWSSPAPARW